MGKRDRKPSDLTDRFWAKVDRRGPDECWPWTGAISKNGYGSFRRCGKAATASRLAYMLDTGTDPGPLSVLHHCDNRPCCNPAHLYAGTVKDNSRDMVERGRHPFQGQRGETNPRARLSVQDVEHVRLAMRLGMNNKQIAALYGVHHATISAIRTGKSWQ